MPNMLKKISVHNSRVTAKALAETTDVTLDGDDNNPGVHEQGHGQLQHQQSGCDDEDVSWDCAAILLGHQSDLSSLLVLCPG